MASPRLIAAADITTGSGSLKRRPITGMMNGSPFFASPTKMTAGRSVTFLHKVYINTDSMDFEFEFFNGYCDSSNNVEFANPNPITIRCSTVTSAVSKHIPFEDGSDRITLQPGARVKTKPLGQFAAAGSFIYLAVYVEVAEIGMYIPMNYAGAQFSSLSNGPPQALTDYADRTHQLTTYSFPGSVSAGAVCFGPVAAWCRQLTPLACIGIAGDSIANGAGGTTGAWLAGYLSIGLGTTAYPVMKNTMPGATGDSFIGLRYQAQDMMRTLDHNIWQYVINDLRALPGGNTSAQNIALMKSKLLGHWKAMSAYGSKITQCTCTPYVPTTSDSYASASGQTPDAFAEPIRQGVNAWLRDGSSTGAIAQSNGALVAIIDACKYCEVDATNTLSLTGSRWLTNGAANYPTTDGTHPTQAMSVIMSAAVTDVLSIFKV